MSGLDIGAREKQGNPKVDDGFKVAKEKITCIAASVDVDEGFESSGVEETRSPVTNGSRSHTNRRYHDKTASVTTNSDGFTSDFEVIPVRLPSFVSRFGPNQALGPPPKSPGLQS
ncbi:hypothetical protein GOBAR_DD11314 [Gossypium barbadense]|nr:hypothetical protein GOBAR_DD11314 [Gossypium barbadense]